MVESRSADVLNNITSTVIASAIRIHRALGPGLLLESAYLACLAHELTTSGQRIELQKAIPLRYRGIQIGCAYRVDMIVDRSVIVEIKALDQVAGIHVRPLLPPRIPPAHLDRLLDREHTARLFSRRRT